MIKTIDIVGSVIVLSSYLLLASASFYALLAILSFFVGVGISAYGLASHTSQTLSFLYLYISAGLFVSIFLIGFTSIATLWVFSIPAITASISLAMTHYAKKDILKINKQKTHRYEQNIVIFEKF